MASTVSSTVDSSSFISKSDAKRPGTLKGFAKESIKNLGRGTVQSAQGENAATEKNLKLAQVGISSSTEVIKNTLQSLIAFEQQSGKTLPELRGILAQATALGDRFLDANVELTGKEAKELVKSFRKADAFLEQRAKSDKLVQEFAKFTTTFEQRARKDTLVNTDINKNFDELSKVVGTQFSKFVSSNISTLSTGTIAKDVGTSLAVTLSGPFAPLVAAIDDIVDVQGTASKGVAAVKNLFAKRKVEEEKQQAKETEQTNDLIDKVIKDSAIQTEQSQESFVKKVPKEKPITEEPLVKTPVVEKLTAEEPLVKTPVVDKSFSEQLPLFQTPTETSEVETTVNNLSEREVISSENQIEQLKEVERVIGDDKDDDSVVSKLDVIAENTADMLQGQKKARKRGLGPIAGLLGLGVAGAGLSGLVGRLGSKLGLGKIAALGVGAGTKVKAPKVPRVGRIPAGAGIARFGVQALIGVGGFKIGEAIGKGIQPKIDDLLSELTGRQTNLGGEIFEFVQKSKKAFEGFQVALGGTINEIVNDFNNLKPKLELFGGSLSKSASELLDSITKTTGDFITRFQEKGAIGAVIETGEDIGKKVSKELFTFFGNVFGRDKPKEVIKPANLSREDLSSTPAIPPPMSSGPTSNIVIQDLNKSIQMQTMVMDKAITTIATKEVIKADLTQTKIIEKLIVQKTPIPRPVTVSPGTKNLEQSVGLLTQAVKELQKTSMEQNRTPVVVQQPQPSGNNRLSINDIPDTGDDLGLNLLNSSVL